MPNAYTLTMDGEDYIIQPGTFVEGAVRRQAEIQEFQEGQLKSRPDTREFWHTSWTGGSKWEQPRYNPQNLNTYYLANNLSFTDRAGTVRPAGDHTFSDSNLDNPRTPLIPWTDGTIDGAVAIDDGGATMRFNSWNGSAFVADSNTFSDINAMAGTVGPTGIVYVLEDNGDVTYWDTSGATVSSVSTGLTIYAGANIWVDNEWVWIYNGDRLYRLDIDDSYNVEEASGTVNDGDGPDILSTTQAYPANPVLPEWTQRRAVNSSEGIFYVKNVFRDGQPVAKVYRIDRDASNTYINTPLGTLPVGKVAINITNHLGSVIVSTLNNYWTAKENSTDARVVFYHITGSSIGSLGSPLGGDSLDETPVWFLGTVDEQLYIGGRKRIWQYDARVGSIHPAYSNDDTLYVNNGGGWWQAAFVKDGSGSGVLFLHCSDQGPYMMLKSEDSFGNSNAEDNYVESNWFDFNLPMEVKNVDEIFVDFDSLGAADDVTIKLLADNGDFQTVATITDADLVGRYTATANVAGHRFRYRIEFSDDTPSAAPTSALLSIGFSATAGEMLDVLQFTINGWETINVQNDVQIPSEVYTKLSTLRSNPDPITVRHYYDDNDLSSYIEGTYKVSSVTTQKDDIAEGMYDVVLIKTTATGITEDTS